MSQISFIWIVNASLFHTPETLSHASFFLQHCTNHNTLCLPQNILEIPDAESSSDPVKRHLHDRCMAAFHEENVFEAITALCEQLPLDKSLENLDLLLVQIYYHAFKLERDPSSLFRSGISSGKVDHSASKVHRKEKLKRSRASKPLSEKER